MAAWGSACAPSRTRWSNDRQTFIIERTAIASFATTTGRFTIASIVTIAAWGWLMIGCDMIEPSAPVLLTVKVPPCRSPSANRLALARVARSRTAWASPAMLR